MYLSFLGNQIGTKGENETLRKPKPARLYRKSTSWEQFMRVMRKKKLNGEEL